MTLPKPSAPIAAATAAAIADVLVDSNASAAFVANTKATVRAFAAWLAERDVTLGDADKDHCLEWLRARGNEVKAVTVAKNWSELRHFYGLAAADTDIIDLLAGKRSPMARIKMPKYTKSPPQHVATVDEVTALIRSFDGRTTTGLRNKAIVSLMFRSGLRVSEVSRLNRGDYLDAERVVVLGVTKNGEARTPVVHPETHKYLAHYLARRGGRPGPLFVNEGRRRQGDRLPTGAIQEIIKRAAAKAKVRTTPHSLRRGFAVEYLAHGGDAATLMILGGWADETMIVRYLGTQRMATARTVFDAVAARQLAARSRTNLHAVQ